MVGWGRGSGTMSGEMLDEVRGQILCFRRRVKVREGDLDE